MKQSIIILFFLLNILAFGQNSKNINKNYYASLHGVKLIDEVKELDLVGRFHKTNGTTGYTILLDSNHKFEKSGHDCYIKSNVDSGNWLINNKRIIIKSTKGATTYDIVKYDRYYFLIPPSQREKFNKDFLLTEAKFKNFKPITHDNITYTIAWMIGYSLIEKYFAKELEDFNGT